MSQEVIRKTQNVLGKYVTKPPLSDKLLAKPPFRYLHDILGVVINEHGFLKGLFQDDELASNSIKDKDTKILFLQKIIDATSLAVNEPLDVRPTKIVAGHEVEKTNLLLQAIAKGIEQKIDSSEAVQQVLSGEGPIASAARSKKSSDGKKSVKSKETKRNSNSASIDTKDDIKSSELKSKDSSTSKQFVEKSIKSSEPKIKSDSSSMGEIKSREPKAKSTTSKSSKDEIKSSEIKNKSNASSKVSKDEIKSKSSESRSRANSKDNKDEAKSNDSKSKSRSSSKDKKEDSKSSDSKSKDSAASKRDKRDGSKPRVKRSSKDDKKASSSKSKESSRASSKEGDGKENAPPEAQAAMISEPTANPIPEMGIGSVPQALRAKSGRQRADHINHEPVDSVAAEETIDDGLILSDEVIVSEAMSPDLMETAPTLIDDNDGPNSLLQINGDPTSEFNLLETEDPIMNIEPMNIDPAILKAMNRDGDLLNQDQLEDGLNPSDSGVGSLESPKSTSKIESLPATAQSKPNSPPPPPPPVPIQPPTPGPGASRPLSAYHPDLKEKDVIPPNALQDPDSVPQKPPERPRTGMGIRPRTGRKSARPPSARPAPPKVRERKDLPQDEIPRPPTGKGIASVILDNNEADQGIDDDDDNFMVGNVEETLIDDDITSTRFDQADPTMEKSKQELIEGDKDAKGILVAQILETKKELEDERREAFSPETPGHRRVPIEQGFSSGDVTRKKEKELIQKDVEKLTSSIQALTRSVNPLAKMLDYLQEDLDSMQKELETWRDENKVLGQKLKAEQSLTEQQLEPLKAQLDEMESAIFDQQDRISAIKSNILRNDDKVSRLLAGINLHS